MNDTAFEPAPAGPGPAPPTGDDATPTRKFCPRCGAPWQATWDECPQCTQAALAATQAVPPARGPSVWSALLLYFVLLGTIIIGAIVRHAGGASEANVLITVSLVDAVLVLGWLVLAGRGALPALSRLGSARWYVIAAAMGTLTFGITMVVVHLLQVAFDLEAGNYSDTFLEGGYGWVMAALMICVQPAVVEEVAFRGVILQTLREPLGKRDAVIVSSLMFMVLHLGVLSFPHLLMIGLALGYLRVRSGSLYPCMLMHFVHNGLVIVAEAGGY
ncbi:hypothetical protein LCGC14_0315810 [marine sediment metagenome]|uniref:CAAX prenyl protease 2/Lysostaphin resistance protein A-like domain-containing protein n=1 Tax=marine sediment metagenome TaxID=412755 RepID=A0A0F9TKX8_9ZZZZ|nr:CPBP family intramembrane metalloprotease [Phycisphaerae bacterium]HDZ44133.1 CPBP family intramembrane metalloprotease [Phycisphaerae bacterium]